MVLYTGGPFIPGRPTPAKPAPSKPSTSAGENNRFAALKAKAATPPKPSPVPRTTSVPSAYRYVPSYASPENAAKVTQQNLQKAVADLGSGSSSKVQAALKVLQPSRTTPSATGTGGSSKTGSIETGIVKKTTTSTGGGTGGGGTGGGGTGGGGTKEEAASKPIGVTLDQEAIDAAQAAADALREFQKNQAQMQLQQALGKIDRAAIEQYKGISEDYAARGLARSGGKLQKEQQAIDERDRAVGEATQAVTDFLNELKLTGNLEQASANLSKSQAFQDYITGRLAPAMGE